MKLQSERNEFSHDDVDIDSKLTTLASTISNNTKETIQIKNDNSAAIGFALHLIALCNYNFCTFSKKSILSAIWSDNYNYICIFALNCG